MLLDPYKRMVEVEVNGTPMSLPENNTLLRGLQHLAPEDISYGPFCWNQSCGSCAVEVDMGEGTLPEATLACQLIVRDGMRIRTVNASFAYCVRSLVCAEARP